MMKLITMEIPLTIRITTTTWRELSHSQYCSVLWATTFHYQVNWEWSFHSSYSNLYFSNTSEGLMYSHIYICAKRSENQGVIAALLSKESQMKRRRQKIVNIQMTIISWSIEFITGLVRLSTYFLGTEASKVLVLILTSIFLNFILIPCLYLLSAEVCKVFVFTRGR